MPDSLEDALVAMARLVPALFEFHSQGETAAEFLAQVETSDPAAGPPAG